MRPECDRRAAVRFYLSLVRVKTTEISIWCARIVLSVLPSFEFMLMLERADCFTLTVFFIFLWPSVSYAFSSRCRGLARARLRSEIFLVVPRVGLRFSSVPWVGL